MFYILKDGRILNNKGDVGDTECLEVVEYPLPIMINDQVGYVSGFSGNEITYEFKTISNNDIQDIIIEETTEITEQQKIMQTFTDIELRDIKAGIERQLLAQKLADIELRLLGGAE